MKEEMKIHMKGSKHPTTYKPVGCFFKLKSTVLEH